MDSTSDALWLLDGVSLPTKAVKLALRLEDRGLKVYRQGEFLKVNDPHAVDGKPVLASGEADEIRQLKPFLLLLVDYCAQDHMPRHMETSVRAIVKSANATGARSATHNS